MLYLEPEMLRSESVPAQLVNSRFCCLSALIGVFVVLVCSLAFADKKVDGLSKSYREWLEKDVLYIITSGEKKAFVELKTSEEREKFIERFWEIRNPLRAQRRTLIKKNIIGAWNMQASTSRRAGSGTGGQQTGDV